MVLSVTTVLSTRVVTFSCDRVYGRVSSNGDLENGDGKGVIAPPTPVFMPLSGWSNCLTGEQFVASHLVGKRNVCEERSKTETVALGAFSVNGEAERDRWLDFR